MTKAWFVVGLVCLFNSSAHAQESTPAESPTEFEIEVIRDEDACRRCLRAVTSYQGPEFWLSIVCDWLWVEYEDFLTLPERKDLDRQCRAAALPREDHWKRNGFCAANFERSNDTTCSLQQ
jgi:hypothetical protein